MPLFDDSNGALKIVDLNDKKVNKIDEKLIESSSKQTKLHIVRRCNLKIADLDLEWLQNESPANENQEY